MIDRRGLLENGGPCLSGADGNSSGDRLVGGLDLRPLLRFDWTQAAIGVAAVVPMSIVFFVAPDLKDRVVDLLGPALAQSRMFDLVLLAAMAGVSEELVFRGALEGWLQRYDIVAAMIVTNLLFGAMHPITLTYFLMAAGFGVYFSVLANLGAEAEPHRANRGAWGVRLHRVPARGQGLPEVARRSAPRQTRTRDQLSNGAAACSTPRGRDGRPAIQVTRGTCTPALSAQPLPLG